MNNDLNFLLAQQGLIKIGTQDNMSKMAFGGLLRTLPAVAKTFLKYKPKATFADAKKFFRMGAPNVAGQPTNRRAYEAAKAQTAQAWGKLNPYVRGALKYPYQAALGYGLGMPSGYAGWAGFAADRVGSLVGDVNAKREGAAQALTEVDKQLANYQNQLANMGLLDRLGMAAGVAFNPSLAPGALGGARTELQQRIEKLTGKPFQAPTVAQ